VHDDAELAVVPGPKMHGLNDYHDPLLHHELHRGAHLLGVGRLVPLEDTDAGGPVQRIVGVVDDPRRAVAG
jgi:hypothetical protein